ncbi:protein FAM186A [Choloepus didactylus]|uniref:protein FAM186A n=1 Tax=Choloepus didactylus TaxID=27675 RepID=UPI00189EA6BD|nr:protein FAM186A [Choloepus didactylus]
MLKAEERFDINMQLNDIMNNVQRIINRYSIEQNLLSGDRAFLTEYQKKRRANFLENMATYPNAVEVREKTLTYILAWLEEWNNVLSEMTTMDVSEYHHWIVQMELLPETFKAIESNVKMLSKISILLFEERKKQKKKRTSRSSLWKSWKERVIKQPATAHALRPDQMISDEFATNTKVSEIQDMLQELIGTAMFNKIENNAIKYISSTIINLSKALSVLNDELKVFNLQSANMHIDETAESEKELSIKIIQDLSEKNEMFQQQLQDADEKCEQLIQSKAVIEQQLFAALSTLSSLKVLPKLSPQSSMPISRTGDREDSMDTILTKEFETIIDQTPKKGTKGSGVKRDPGISYAVQAEMIPDLTQEQYILPEKKQKKSSAGITEDKGNVYQKDRTDQYQSQKRRYTKESTYIHGTSGSKLSDDKGEQKVSGAKPIYHPEQQALGKKGKEIKSFFEAKLKSTTESKSQHIPSDFPSTEPKSKGGRSVTSDMWERVRKVKPEFLSDKQQISSEAKVEATTESKDDESKSLAEPLGMVQLDHSSEPQKGKKRKHQISSGTSKEEKAKQKDMISFTKKMKPHQLVKLQSRIAKETSESTRALENGKIKSDQSNQEEFHKALMTFLNEKIDNIGKPFVKKTVVKEELLKKEEVEKLGIIKAKMDEYFQKVAEIMTKTLRKYNNMKQAEQGGEKPKQLQKTVIFMPGSHFLKSSVSTESEISTFLSYENLDPILNNLMQIILTEIESEREVPIVSIAGKDHKEKEEQRWEEDEENVSGMSLKHQLLEERNLWKESHEMMNKYLEEDEARPQMKEGKQWQQKQKQWQKKEMWKEQEKQGMQKWIEKDEKQKQREKEEEELQNLKQQLEAWEQKMKEQGVLLEMSQVQEEVRQLELKRRWEKNEEMQKSRRKAEDYERQRQKISMDQLKIKKEKPEELEKLVSQTSVTLSEGTLSPSWKSMPKDASWLYLEESHRNLKTLDILPDRKHYKPFTPPTSTQSSPPISRESPANWINLTLEQAQELGITLTREQVQAQGIALTLEQAQALGITLTPQQAQAQEITLTPQQAQAQGLTFTPEQIEAQGITLTPPQIQAQGITLRPEQAEAQGITLTPEQAQAQGIMLTPAWIQAQGITLTPQQVQAQRITLTPQQAQAQGITLSPEHSQAQGISLTPQQIQAQGIILTPQQIQTQEITLTLQQAQAQGITFTPEQIQAQGITLAPQQIKAQGITLTPEQAQAQGVICTPEQVQTQRITLTPQQIKAQGITLTPEQAQAQGITLTPEQAQTQGITLTPQQAQAQGITFTPEQIQAQGIILNPQQVQAQRIPLTPEQIQAQGITLTPEQAQAQGITPTPQQAQAQGITLSPQQAQAQGITLTPEQIQAQEITFTPEQIQAQLFTLTPQQAQAQGITLTPEQIQAQLFTLTPQQAQAQGITLIPEQIQAQGITLTPEQIQAQWITLIPKQIQAQGISLTPEQIQAQGISLTPEQIQAQGITLTPEQIQAQGIALMPEQIQAQGITITPEQIQAQGITLTPEQAQAQGITLTPEQIQTQGITLTPQQAQAQGITLTPKQAQALGITLTPEQFQALGVTRTPEKSQSLEASGIPITPENAWMSTVTPNLRQTQALGSPLTLEEPQALGVPVTPEHIWELEVPLTSDKDVASGPLSTPEMAPPLGVPFTTGQDQSVGVTIMPEQDLKSRSPLAEQPSRLQAGPPSGHTLEVGILPITIKPITPSAPHIPKQPPTLAPSTLRPFQELKASLPSGKSFPSRSSPGPRQFLASSPIAEKSSILGASSTPLQISGSPLTQAPFAGKSLEMGISSDSGKLLEPQTFPSFRGTRVSAPVRFLAPKVPAAPGQLPISKFPLTPRQPLKPRVPHTSAQIPSLQAPLSPRKPLVSRASSICGELLESGPPTFPEQPQAVQFSPSPEQSLHSWAPFTHGQHLAPGILPIPGQPSPLWIPPSSGKPRKDSAFSVSEKSKKGLAIVSSLKSKPALVYPSTPKFKATQVPFTTKKLQMPEVSDISEEKQILQDSFDVEQFRTFQSYLSNYRTQVSQNLYIDEEAIPTLMKPMTSLHSLTTELPKTSQFLPSEWGQKSRFPPIDKSWVLTSVPATKKPKIMVPPSSPQELEEEEKRYFVDVESQRENLVLLNQATRTSGLPSWLHKTARNLIIETLHTDTVQLGYIFHKYIAYRLIQRNNIIKQLQAIQNTGKGNETRNLYNMLNRIDDYQKKVMQVWTEKQKSLEKKRNQCLKKMMHLYSQLQETYELNLSQPIALITDKKQIPASTEFVHRPFLELLIEEDRKYDTVKKFRKQEDQMEAIWNADLSTSSYPITEKTSIGSLWAQLGGYPDIPRMLQLDVQSTLRKSLASIQSQFQKIPK